MALLAAISDREDKELVEKYVRKCKRRNRIEKLVEKAPSKDEEGV
jgi:hypothetical protein